MPIDQHQTKTKSSVKGTDCNKFEDPIRPVHCSNIYPPPITAWLAALKTVNHNASHVQTRNETDSGYVFPEPASFIVLENPDHHHAYFRAWLKHRPSIIYRLMDQSHSSVRPVSNQVW